MTNNDLLRTKAEELEKKLKDFTSSLKDARSITQFNELLEGAIDLIEHTRLKY